MEIESEWAAAASMRPRPGWGDSKTAFLLGRAVSIIEGLVESPTDAIDIRMAEEFLADYRKWLEAAS